MFSGLRKLGFDSYRQYLRSSLWDSIRSKVLERAEGKCELCKRRKAVQVHHLSYQEDVLAGKALEEMVAVCGRCHLRIEFTASGQRRPFPEMKGLCARLLRRSLGDGTRKKKKKVRCQRCGNLPRRGFPWCRKCAMILGKELPERSRKQRKKSAQRPRGERARMYPLEYVKAQEAGIRARLEEMGCELRSIYHWHRDSCAHWLVDKDGIRILDLWPTTGHWWSQQSKSKGDVKSLEDIVAVVAAAIR